MKMNFAGRELDMSRCHVMGVLNVTPDSFSDGGQFNRPDAALVRARQMVADGATFIDIGGEQSTGWDASQGENPGCLLTGRWGYCRRLDDGSRMSREVHVRF